MLDLRSILKIDDVFAVVNFVSYLVLYGCTRFYRVLPSFTGFYRVIVGYARFWSGSSDLRRNRGQKFGILFGLIWFN